MKKIGKAVAAIAFVASATAAHAGAFSEGSMVNKRCTDCHEIKGGKIARVESFRTTPEEWRVIVDRMKRLHGMELAKGELDQIVKELCATQILTPDEQAKVSYLSLKHNSQFMEGPVGADQEQVFATCVRCHSAGKIWSYRMTEEEWKKIPNEHLYFIPSVYMQMREMRWVPAAEKAVAYLAKELAYDKAYTAADSKLAGSWVVMGREPGKGEYRGEATFTDKGKGEYSLAGKIYYTDGTYEDVAGTGTLYGGYALRTKTNHNNFDTFGAFILRGDEMTGENHFGAPEFRTSSVAFVRQNGAAKALRMTPAFIIAGEEKEVTIEGMNLPDAKAGDITFSGANVQVLSATRTGPDAITVKVSCKEAKAGEGSVEVKGAGKVPVRFAGGIDSIAVTPGTGRARLSGGPNYPSEGVQFEAIAFAKTDKGEMALGPVPAKFHLEEEVSREGDDDLQWVGGIGKAGSYVPMGDYSPISARKSKAEGSGWVKVVADYDYKGKALKGESKLAVTLPDFITRIR